MTVGIYILIFLITLSGVEVFRRWSRRRRLFDVPNERSSHTTPTPTGGGLIIAIVCLTVYTLTTLFVTNHFQWSYLVGAGLIALISWLDDLFTISFVWRFFVQSLAALIIISTLGYFEEISLPVTFLYFQNVNFGYGGALLTFLWIVWLTNAYNFMDGIDGLAGIQTVAAGLGWLLVGKFFGAETVGFYGGVIMFSSLGFLIVNWQPAKIFMGDVGSAFLGYSFAVLPLLAKDEINVNLEKRAALLPIAVLFVWLFVFDTLWTFARRVLNGEKVWEAHRGHLYQQIVIEGFSHRMVAGLYGVFSILNVLFTYSSLEYNRWENLLILFIGVQSVGLILGIYFFRK